MINCPYCHVEIEDDAKSCPRCSSMLVTGKRNRAGHFPKYKHPAAALILVLLLSLGLAAATLTGQKAPKPTSDSEARELAEEEPSPAGALAGAVRDKDIDQDKNGGRVPRRIGRRGHPAGDDNTSTPDAAVTYEEMIQYYDQIVDLLGEAEVLCSNMDSIREENDTSKLPEMTQDIRNMMTITNKIRAIRPPSPLREEHLKLSNSLAKKRLGYNHLRKYLQTGDVSSLDKGRNEIELADSVGNSSMAAIEKFKDSIPVPIEPPEEVPEENKPEPEPESKPEPGARPADDFIDPLKRREKDTKPAPDMGPLDSSTLPQDEAEDYVDDGYVEPIDGGSYVDDEQYDPEGEDYYEDAPVGDGEYMDEGGGYIEDHMVDDGASFEDAPYDDGGYIDE